MGSGNDTVLVLGGSGFLGSHVADALTLSGYRVRVFDAKPSPYLRSEQEMVTGDVLDADAVMAAAEGARYVYNFAGLADLEDARNRPLETAKLNVLGTVHALEAARVHKAERFIFASSVYVYSDTGSFYRASKQSAERFVETYQERFGLDYTVVRYGSLYGRRADERNAIYRFLEQALADGQITFTGSADAQREYIHVEDAARLSVQVLQTAYCNRHLVLTGQERFAVRDIMKMISEIMPHDVELRFEDGGPKGHYEMTPYAFNPRVGHKLVANDFVDIGQGLLDCLRELHEHLHATEYKDRRGEWLLLGDHEHEPVQRNRQR